MHIKTKLDRLAVVVDDLLRELLRNAEGCDLSVKHLDTLRADIDELRKADDRTKPTQAERELADARRANAEHRHMIRYLLAENERMRFVLDAASGGPAVHVETKVGEFTDQEPQETETDERS